MDVAYWGTVTDAYVCTIWSVLDLLRGEKLYLILRVVDWNKKLYGKYFYTFFTSIPTVRLEVYDSGHDDGWEDHSKNDKYNLDNVFMFSVYHMTRTSTNDNSSSGC